MNTLLQRIAVLVSVGRHPVSGVARYSRNDAAALSMADALAAASVGISIDIIHAGNPDNPALSDYLALGAKNLKVINTAADQDILPGLKPPLENYDLVLCGSRAEGGEESGLVPYLLASQLGWPLIAGVIAVTPETDGGGNGVLLKQFLPKGRRREIAVSLPAILVVHPLAPSTVRYAYANLRAGTIHRQAAQNASPAMAQQDWILAPAKARPIKLVAQEKRSGHARMLSATVTESRGGKVIQQGSPGDKAQAVLAYLREHRLIDY
ncbi:drug:proton antiporter [Glaciimonas sp. PCH181]|uniref:drug:proton antiporter n=1 Tax=Glaciimonas sp. PCH181 TaxID=2133943 RepID=UPI000D34F4A4|nr:drug:proton antiporter [Glaciimonas sp. PCH181]PUA16713.1 drug:proton antiporter [Glaciimonas sp. PCH181]